MRFRGWSNVEKFSDEENGFFPVRKEPEAINRDMDPRLYGLFRPENKRLADPNNEMSSPEGLFHPSVRGSDFQLLSPNKIKNPFGFFGH